MTRSFRAALALTLALLPALAASAPQRVMSLNLCADVLALHLLPRERIASVSFLAATSPLSPVQELAQGLPTNDAQIEEIISARPDLVLTHQFGDPRVLRWLERLGIDALTIELPTSIESAVVQWRRVGAALNESERAAALVAEAQKALAGGRPDRFAGPLAARARDPETCAARLEWERAPAAAPAPIASQTPCRRRMPPSSLQGRPSLIKDGGESRGPVRSDASAPLAAVYGANGITQGRNSLLDDLLRAAGFRNLAAELGFAALATLPLEQLALTPPELLVLARDAPRIQTLADMSLGHPLLRRLAQQATVVELPGRYWSCGGPELIEALTRLQRARQGAS